MSLMLLSTWVCCHVVQFMGTSILEELAGPIFRLPLREFYFCQWQQDLTHIATFRKSLGPTTPALCENTKVFSWVIKWQDCEAYCKHLSSAKGCATSAVCSDGLCLDIRVTYLWYSNSSVMQTRDGRVLCITQKSIPLTRKRNRIGNAWKVIKPAV